MSKPIYGIPRNTCGVYLLKCKVNGYKYVGSSVDISARLSTHFGRDAKHYVWRELYQDIVNFGRNGFEWQVLELCSREQLIERELYYYELLKPEYNLIAPSENNFDNPLVKELSKVATCIKTAAKLKAKYALPEYKALFKHIQQHRLKAVAMFKDGIEVNRFESLSECARWLSENTSFKGKNKVSKIKAVCDGERPTAYGFVFRYFAKCND